MLESKIKTKVCTRLKKNGWMIVHLIQTNTNGIPDTMCLKNGICVFLEFKQQGLKPDPLQVVRIKQLIKQGFKAIVVDNVDFNM